MLVDMPTGDVGELVEKLQEKFPEGARFRLGAKLLEVGKDISEYVAEHMSIIHVLLPLVGGKKGKVQANVRQKEHYDPTPMKMSRCALKLALMHANPFDPAVPGVCGIAGSTAIPTVKASATTRIDVTVGLGGYGFMYICPALANNSPAIFASTSDYNSSGLAPLMANSSLNDGVAKGYFQDLPFSASELISSSTTNGVAVAGRMLGLGVRALYTGTADNRGGLLVSHRSPLHANESVWQTPSGGVLTFSNLLGYNDSSTVTDLKGDDILLVDHPVSTEERAFPTGDASNIELVYPYSANENMIGDYSYQENSMNVGAPTMVLAVKGTPGNSYMFEVIMHAEYLFSGGVEAYGITSSPVELDGDGNEILLNSIRTMDGKRKPSDRWRALRSGLKQALHVAAGIAIPMTEAALSAAVMG